MLKSFQHFQFSLALEGPELHPEIQVLTSTEYWDGKDHLPQHALNISCQWQIPYSLVTELDPSTLVESGYGLFTCMNSMLWHKQRTKISREFGSSETKLEIKWKTNIASELNSPLP